MQTVLLLRHGYPRSWDERLPIRGSEPHRRLDSGLADIGVRQAAATAVHLATGGVTQVLSSPFRRCLETADALAATAATAGSAVEVVPDWRIGEVLISDVLGSPFGPTTAMDPEWAPRRAGAGKPSHPESDRTVQDRVARFAADLKARKPFAQRIVVVSHEIILKALFTALTGRAAILDWHPCGVAVLHRATPADRQWRLSGALGAVQHLGDLDRTEPMEQVVVKYHHLDSRS